VELRGIYDEIRCPTLVLRGESSDLLRWETAKEMSARGPRAEVVEIAGVGHAPTPIREEQIRVVRKFLHAREYFADPSPHERWAEPAQRHPISHASCSHARRGSSASEIESAAASARIDS
jgi:hypothetical protein